MAVREWTDTKGRLRFLIDYYPNGYQGGRRVFKLKSEFTREQAEKIEKDLRAKKKNNLATLPSGNIARLIKRYVEYCRLHMSPDTASDKASNFETHIIPFFGHMHVPDITNAHITAYKQQMKGKTYRGKPITNRTINKGMSYFSAFIKWCADELDMRPITPIRFKKMPHTRPVPIVLSMDEAMAFIQAADRKCKLADLCRGGNRQCVYRVAYNVMFKTFFYLGLRNRAVRRLRWEDMDWTKHAIKTTEKGGKVKWHPLPDDLLEELRGLYVGSISPYIYPSPKDLNKPVNNILKGVKRARLAAGITKRVYPHLLRHSIATHLIDSDVDIRQIQDFLDHRHISTTEFYTQVSMEKKRQALEKAGIKTSKT